MSDIITDPLNSLQLLISSLEILYSTNQHEFWSTKNSCYLFGSMNVRKQLNTNSHLSDVKSNYPLSFSKIKEKYLDDCLSDPIVINIISQLNSRCATKSIMSSNVDNSTHYCPVNLSNKFNWLLISHSVSLQSPLIST